jgi:hypothetical protein
MKPTAPEKDEVTGRFLAGNSGNGGRKRGSRNKLASEFIDALCSDFEQHGAGVIAKVRAEKPDVYLKVVANLMPAKLEALLEAKVDVNYGLDGAQSVAEVLEMVAKEAGAEAAMKLAEVFGIEAQDFGDGMVVLPPPPAPINPYPRDTVKWREWNRGHRGRFEP